ncbi:MAG: ribonuclease domain-containing protein [Candidatus Izemoplasmatales bacterium]
MHIITDEYKRRIIRVLYFFVLVTTFIFSLTTRVNVNNNSAYSKDKEVMLYIIEYKKVPINFLPKSESAYLLGEQLLLYDVFRNDELILPEDEYLEVYINAFKTDAGSERVVFSDDKVYYTDDHYQTFKEIDKYYIIGLNLFISVILFVELFLGAFLIHFAVKKQILSKRTFIEDIKSDLNLIKRGLKNSYLKLKNIFKKRG